jgi:hypothetical protein
MAEKLEIAEVQERLVGGTPCWLVIMNRENGLKMGHLMPQEIIDNRAAEYGLDPADIDSILEIILHEEHLPMVEDPVTGTVKHEDDDQVVTSAESTTQAREAHLARLKKSRVSVKVKGSKPLDKIRKGHRSDPDRLAKLKEHFDTRRWVNRYGALPSVYTADLKRRSAAEKMTRALQPITVTLPDLSRE